jgi:hypothetical protein
MEKKRDCVHFFLTENEGEAKKNEEKTEKVKKVRKKVVSLQPQTKGEFEEKGFENSSLKRWRGAANIPV